MPLISLRRETKGDVFRSRWIAGGVFLLAFFIGPIAHLDGLSLMPGDLGDPRLNNYFLENIYQFLRGKSDSLWHLGFYFPFPWVGGFSDNLFGASPIYILARASGFETDTSFQIWFLAAYAANYGGMYWTLRKLGFSIHGAILGALIFSFSLPVTAYEAHAQLHYRFAVPLTIYHALRFLTDKSPKSLAYAALWLAWQFYLTIYIGFFTLVFLTAMGLIELGTKMFDGWGALKNLWFAHFLGLRRQDPEDSRFTWFMLAVALTLMGLLFYPYWEVTHLYEAKRGAEEIRMMLPRPESYLYTNVTAWWPLNISQFGWLPNHSEHQMFWGLVPLLLMVFGIIRVGRRRAPPEATILLGALILLMTATLMVNGHSLWLGLIHLPLFSAIRAVSRIDLVFLFPVAYLSALGLEQPLSQAFGRSLWIPLILLLFLIEATMVKSDGTSKQLWRQHMAQKSVQVPSGVPSQKVLFFAQGKDHPVIEELDAIWAALMLGHKTLNGYSGMMPAGLMEGFGTDCTELVRRVLVYRALAAKKGLEAITLGPSEVQPIGFGSCPLLERLPQLKRTSMMEHYPAPFFGHIQLFLGAILKANGETWLRVTVSNQNPQGQSLRVAGPCPVSLSFRWLDGDGLPITDWENRYPLPFDLDAQENLSIDIPVDLPTKPRKSDRLEISMVHEERDWAHDVGMGTLKVTLQ